jgi:hypothetical protein
VGCCGRAVRVRGEIMEFGCSVVRGEGQWVLFPAMFRVALRRGPASSGWNAGPFTQIEGGCYAASTGSPCTLE